MRGVLLACLGGIFLTLQGTANAAIGGSIGTWQAATLTQGVGFVAALVLALAARDRTWRNLKRVKPVYLLGGGFAAFIIFSNITAIHHNGAALTVAAVLISQIAVTLLIERAGGFGKKRARYAPSQWVGFGCMMLGIVFLTL